MQWWKSDVELKRIENCVVRQRCCDKETREWRSWEWKWLKKSQWRSMAVIMKTTLVTNVMTLPGKYLHTVELRRHYICLIPWKLRCPKEKDKSKNFKHTLHTILKHNCSKFCSERFHLHLCFLHLGSDAGYWPPSRCRPDTLDHVPRWWHL